MKSPHSQGLVSPNGAMQWPSRAHLEGKITVQVIYNIHIPNFIRFKCCTASGWQPWPLTAVIFKIPDSREKKQVKKEYTFQFLISFLTQYIAGLSELLAAKWPLVMRVNWQIQRNLWPALWPAIHNVSRSQWWTTRWWNKGSTYITLSPKFK